LANTIEVKHAATAAEFWSLLSPEKPLFPQPSKLLYRGQGDDRWSLTPGILRRGMSSAADFQVFKEWAYIETFVRHCDSIGLSVPNDSPTFREQFLNQNSPKGPGGSVSEWPPKELHPLMALAQHYRLPTRLLDWSMRAYVAAYFAISDALSKINYYYEESDGDTRRLAVWVLDIEKRALFRELKVVTVPGGNNANLAAQSGRFTLLTQTGGRGTPFTGEMALDLYFGAQSLPSPLKKVTLPISEAPAALAVTQNRPYRVT
jgi:FRG domain